MNRYRASDANLGRLTPFGLTWATFLVPLMQAFGHQRRFQLVRGRMRTASWIVMTKRCQFASFGQSCFSRQAMALGTTPSVTVSEHGRLTRMCLPLPLNPVFVCARRDAGR